MQIMSDRKNVRAILKADWDRADSKYARWQEAEANRFREAWPAMTTTASDGPLPDFSWGELERQLTDLATPEAASLVSSLVSATRKQARFKPPELVLRELLCIAAAVMDESFHPSQAAMN
jgi:hypothetical protein